MQPPLRGQTFFNIIAAYDAFVHIEDRIISFLENMKNLLNKDNFVNLYSAGNLKQEIGNLDKEEIEIIYAFENMAITDNLVVRSDQLYYIFKQTSIQKIVDSCFSIVYDFVLYNLECKAGQYQEKFLYAMIESLSKCMPVFRKSKLVTMEVFDESTYDFVKDALNILFKIEITTYKTKCTTLNLISKMVLLFKTEKCLQNTIITKISNELERLYSNFPENLELEPATIENLVLLLVIVKDILEGILQNSKNTDENNFNQLSAILKSLSLVVPEYALFLINECKNIIHSITFYKYV